MIIRPVAVPRSLQVFLILSGIAALQPACDANVVIGAKLSVEEEPGGDGGTGGTLSQGGSSSGAGTGAGGAGSNAGGTEMVMGGSAAGGEGGASIAGAGAGGAPPVVEWCATSPWKTKTTATFGNEAGTEIPAGMYVLRYDSGGQVHDLNLGFEVTGHYFFNSIEAGHHVFGGDSVATGAPSIWLEDTGLVRFGANGTLAEVEEANRDHTWPPFEHPGGPLHVTLLDNDFTDNKGPGTTFCITVAPAP